jgi:hypothetical protein
MISIANIDVCSRGEYAFICTKYHEGKLGERTQWSSVGKSQRPDNSKELRAELLQLR